MNPGRSRLYELQRATIEAGREMEGEASRFSLIAGNEPTRAISAFNLFQTPEPLADRMAQMLAGCDGPWLEPSAGLGRLYFAARHVYAGPMTLVENSPDCAGELYRQVSEDKGATLRQRDFLACSVADLCGPFGAIIMNPPFKRGLDVEHIRHAATMLKPGGLLVSLCYNGAAQNRKLKPLADSWEVLPPGSFKAEGTGAVAVLLTWKRGG